MSLTCVCYLCMYIYIYGGFLEIGVLLFVIYLIFVFSMNLTNHFGYHLWKAPYDPINYKPPSWNRPQDQDQDTIGSYLAVGELAQILFESVVRACLFDVFNRVSRRVVLHRRPQIHNFILQKIRVRDRRHDHMNHQ